MESDIIFDISHELRTQLASVRSLSEVLHDYPNIDEHTRREFTGIIMDETDRLTRLTNHVLNMLSGFQLGQTGIEPIMHVVSKEGDTHGTN